MGPFGPALALSCRIVLAGVLAVAAVAKIADRRALPPQLRAMGIASPWDARSAMTLPVAELVVAGLLVGWRGSAVPAVAAGVLLLVFSGFLVLSVRRAVPCPCFGVVGNERAASASGAVVRNGFLIGLAVIGTGSVDGARAGAVLVVTAIGAAAATLLVTRVA